MKILWGSHRFYEDNDEESDDDDDDDKNENDNVVSKLKFPNEIISTPIGGMFRSEGWNPLHDREMYIANVDFVLTTVHIKLISSILGVEHIHVISPYSFSIVIGLLFDNNEVIMRIEDALGISSEEKEYIDENSPLYDIISPIIKRLVSNKYWMLYILPNGKYLERVYDNQQDFTDDIDKFRGIDDGNDFIGYTSGIYFDSETELED